MMIDYQKILKQVEGFSPQRLSNKKKFENRQIDRKSIPYEVYFTSRQFYFDENAYRKYCNHLKILKVNYCLAQKHFNHNKYYRIKGKGLFSFCIRNHFIDSPNFLIEITRTKMELGLNNQIFNLNDKSERFAALMYFTFDYDCLVQIQNILKKKPSGFYNIDI